MEEVIVAMVVVVAAAVVVVVVVEEEEEMVDLVTGTVHRKYLLIDPAACLSPWNRSRNMSSMKIERKTNQKETFRSFHLCFLPIFTPFTGFHFVMNVFSCE